MGKNSSLYQGVPCFPRHLASLSKVNEARGVGTVIGPLAGNGEGDTEPCYVAYHHKSYKVFFSSSALVLPPLRFKITANDKIKEKVLVPM